MGETPEVVFQPTGRVKEDNTYDPDGGPKFAYCVTMLGLQRIGPNDWVVTHPEQGSKVVPPELFRRTYVKVEG